MKYGKLGSIVIAASLMLSACGGSKEAPGTAASSGEAAVPPKTSSEPVTLTMTSYNTSTNEAEFKSYMEPYIQKKFPHITLKWIEPTKGQTLNDQIAAGQPPDIVATGYSHILALLDLDIPLDLNELAKKTKFDAGKFDPIALNSIKMYGDKGELYGLPYVNNYFALLYNKDLFDKYGVPYPKDGMSWEDAIELGKRVSRLDDGVQYRGLLPATGANIFGRGLSLPLVDPKTDKALLNTDKWSHVYQTMKAIYKLPGNEELSTINQVNEFLDGKAAMITNWGQATVNMILKGEETGKKLNWDMATYPFFKETPNKNPEISTNIYVVSKTTKHRDAAFDVISYLSSSVEVQTAQVKLGMRPVIKIDNIKELFGQDIPGLKGKNVEAAYKHASHDDHPPSRFDTIASNAVNKYFGPFEKGELDVREALSRAEEEANKNISAEKIKLTGSSK